MNGKGDTPRPMQINRDEYCLRWDYAYGKLTSEEFDRRLKEIKNVERKRNRRTS